MYVHTYKQLRDREIDSKGLRSWVLLGQKGAKPVLSNAKLGLPDEAGHAFFPSDVNNDGAINILDITTMTIIGEKNYVIVISICFQPT